jgi:hypothetical protein
MEANCFLMAALSPLTALVWPTSRHLAWPPASGQNLSRPLGAARREPGPLLAKAGCRVGASRGTSGLLVRQQTPRTGSNSARVRWTEAPAAPLPGGSVIGTAEPPEPTLDCTSDRFRHPAHTKRHGPNHRRSPPGCSTVFDRTMSQNWAFCLRCTRYQARLPPAPSRRYVIVRAKDNMPSHHTTRPREALAEPVVAHLNLDRGR